MSSTFNTLVLERDGHIGWLRLNRPEKLNSFSIEMWRELRTLGQEIRDDPDLRVLVVIGNGRAFSSGIDTSVFTGGSTDSIEGGESERREAGIPPSSERGPSGPAPGAESGEDDVGSRHADPTVDGILRTQEAYNWLAEASYPTIAAVRGYALGAGLQIALACDIRVFAKGTSVGLLEHKYGILPDLGGTQRLPRVVGAGKAKEMIWTAARVDADEAYRIGLCEQLVEEPDLEKEVEALARTIALQPPLAVQGAKRAVDAAGRVPVAEGLIIEAQEQAVCLRSNDMREAITAFVEQRAADYTAT